MKIGIFTDSHFSSAKLTCGNRYNSKSLEKIKQAYKVFGAEKCDLVICLGDLIDREDEHEREIDNLKKVSKVLSDYDIKTYIIMGNHDAFAFDVEEFYNIVGEQYKPENIYADTKNLVFLDACYFRNGAHYKPGDSDWTDTCYPMVDKLEKLLNDIDGDVYVFMHQNIDPVIDFNHRISNCNEVRSILKNSNKVKTVFQGHYHPGMESEHDGIMYITYPAMCVNEKAYYVIEI